MANFKDILEGVEGDSRRLLRILRSAKYRGHLKFPAAGARWWGRGRGWGYFRQQTADSVKFKFKRDGV